jgi:transcriptional repressor NrdR
MVMERLKDLNEVAYIRFASVPRQFNDLSAYQKELRLLQQEK